jgi:uncharacterized membrane protein
MFILAGVDPFSWTSFLREDAPLWSLFVVFLFICLKYIPTWFSKQNTMMDHSIQTQTMNTFVLNDISRQVAADGEHNARQHQAAGHLARALEEMTPEERREQVRAHLDRMQSVLRNEQST